MARFEGCGMGAGFLEEGRRLGRRRRGTIGQPGGGTGGEGGRGGGALDQIALAVEADHVIARRGPFDETARLA